MSILDKIIDGVKAVAPAVANTVLPGSGLLLETLMRTVTGEGPETPLEEVAAKIHGNPELLLELHTRAMDHEARMDAQKVQKLAVVNATMQAEAKSEKWPQYSWRPFNGFFFPVAVISIYCLLPAYEKTVPDVPQWVWVGWLSILGVATWDRGKEKRLKAGDQPIGMLTGVIQAIRKQ